MSLSNLRITYSSDDGTNLSNLVASYIKKSPTLRDLANEIYDEIYYSGMGDWDVKFGEKIGCIDSENRVIYAVSASSQRCFSSLKFLYAVCDKVILNVKYYDENQLQIKAEQFACFLNLIILNNKRELAPKPEFGHCLFTSAIYTSIHQQIFNFIQRYRVAYPHSSLYLEKEFAVMTRFVMGENYAGYHKTLLKILRALKKEPLSYTLESAERKQFLKEFSYWLFTSIELDQERWEFLLKKCFFAISYMPKDLAHLTHVVCSLYSNPLLAGVIEHPFSDMHQAGCITGRLQQLTFGSNSTTLLQMPQLCYCEMRENYGVFTQAFNILPEAKAFFELLKEKKEKLLYINLMKEKKLANKCQETEHTTHIVEVVSFLKIESLKIVSFDRYSDVATQRGVSSGNWNQFLHTMIIKCSESFGCLKGFDGAILDKMHKHYFDAKEELSVEERREFYEILLIEVLSKYLIEHKYDFLTVACASSTEESGSFAALLYLHQTVKQGKSLTADFYKKIFTMLFLNSVAVKNQPPSIYYINLFHTCAKRILEKGPLS